MASTYSATVPLSICAFSDFVAVPLLLGTKNVPTVVGILVGVLGLLTLVATVGVARHAHWAARLAIVTRVVDTAAATPALAASSGMPVIAAVVTIALSITALALLIRPKPSTDTALESRLARL
jgi:hypothetical protein